MNRKTVEKIALLFALFVLGTWAIDALDIAEVTGIWDKARDGANALLSLYIMTDWLFLRQAARKTGTR
jgi:hypothetical protein